MKHLMTTVALLLSVMTAYAEGNVTVNVTPANAGEVESSISQADGKCTLTVTPASGYYMTVAGLKAVKIIDAGQAQAPQRAPGIDGETITITPTNASADPSGVTTYTFDMPATEYDVEVTATFSQRISINDATLTLSETTFTYDGTAKKPGVTVKLDETTLEAANYAVSYKDSINAGTATVEVNGRGIYTGVASTTYTINKAELDLSVTLEGWTFGDNPNQPVVEGNAGNGAVTYAYKVQGADDETYSATVPNAVGSYVVRATVAATDNYNGGTATAEFSISRQVLDADKVIVGSNTWATYFNATVDQDLPAGFAAYVVTAVSGTTVTAQALTYVPQNVPVLLERTETAVTGNDTYTQNLLQGSAEATEVSSITGGNVYVLYNDEFVLSTSGEIPAGRAWLVVAASNGAPRRLSISRNDDTTGISETLAAPATTEAPVYDLSGRQVKKAGKGVFIVGGKKMIFK